ncbi:MAG: Plug domain-containing protein [Candidatus Electryonea clarkiae]|nr:Plug domain-containing protein [Candidatus Electryonea clarkiae]MDP8288450.1 Plug domain-containing protein [Candidatus Electryonea clarkiae]
MAEKLMPLQCTLLTVFLIAGISDFSNADQISQGISPVQVEKVVSDSLLRTEEISLPVAVPGDSTEDSTYFANSDSIAVEGDSLVSLPDSAEYIAVDSLSGLNVDSMSIDSTQDSDIEPIPEPESLDSDTIPPRQPSPTATILHREDFSRFGYKDAGEAIGTIHGIYPRQSSFFGQPFYLIPPGGSGRDLLVLYRGRPYNDPVTGAASFNTFAVEEIERVDLETGWSGVGISNSGPVLTLHPISAYLTTPLTNVIFRKGFYGLGHADWRIAQKLTKDFRYHAGIDIGEYRGRRHNSQANSAQLRLGGRRRLSKYGNLDFSWMQSEIKYGRAKKTGYNNIRRNDFDLAWSSGEIVDSSFSEAAAWYVRSERGYFGGREQGYRLGGRLLHERQISSHRFGFTVDSEKTGALFGTFPSMKNPKGQREIGGITLSDRIDKQQLKADIAVRGEAGTIALYSDGRGRKILPRFGGAFSVDYGDVLGPGVIGSSSLGWRWPALDESYGLWFVHSPERLMDLNPVPDSLDSYSGDATLEPVGGFYSGAGGRWRFSERRGIRLVAGYRRYIKPIIPMENITAPGNWTAVQDDNHEGIELTGNGWVDVYGPFSLAGAFTITDVKMKESSIPGKWGWGSLRFENHYFSDQLRMRITFTSYYWGEYDYQDQNQRARMIQDGMIAAKIMDFEVYWGTNNIFSHLYDYQPGNPSMFREEVWGVRWILWN